MFLGLASMLKANKFGKITVLSYIPNAFMCNFISLLEMTKWYHQIVIGLFTVIWAFVIKAKI